MKPKRCPCVWETAPKAQSCFRLLEPRCEDIEHGGEGGLELFILIVLV
jgi:hypothetical protein